VFFSYNDIFIKKDDTYKDIQYYFWFFYNKFNLTWPTTDNDFVPGSDPIFGFKGLHVEYHIIDVGLISIPAANPAVGLATETFRY